MNAFMHWLGRPSIKKVLALSAVIVLISLVAACGGEARPVISFQGDFLPFAIHYSPPDHISFTGEKSYVTPIGEFSVGAEYQLPKQDAASIYVILRDRTTGFDHIYQVHTDGEQLTAVMNGRTVIGIGKNKVLIDITRGIIKSF